MDYSRNNGFFSITIRYGEKGFTVRGLRQFRLSNRVSRSYKGGVRIMATCKDCLHVDVCEDIARHKLSPERAKEVLPILRNSRKICDHFQDRSQFVKLPCKPRETIYRICPVNEGEPCCNCSWQCCDCYDIGFQSNCSHNSIRVGTAGGVEWIMKRAHYFGKIYFSTREEAEKVLKERESND